MSEIEASQHIYANLNAEQSPGGRGGFQTVFYTRSALTEAEVEEMEGRLVYFRSEQEPVKRVFFVTSTGKPVVAQIVSLGAADSIGRQGPYLAHGLVFPQEPFGRSGVRPLSLCARFAFARSVPDALSRGSFETGDMAPVAVAFADQDAQRELEAARRWPRQGLKSLALLALRADGLARQRVTLAFVGEAPQVETALLAAFLAVPAPLVAHCTFDTFFYRCNPIAAYYWAAGLPERPNNPKFLVVDARSHQPPEVRGPPATSYERWVVEVIDAGSLDSLARHRETAFVLCQWLDGRPHEPTLIAQASALVVDSVFQANLAVVRERLRSRLSEQCSAALASFLCDEVFRRKTHAELLAALQTGFEASGLLDVCFAVCQSRGFNRPARDQLQGIARLLDQADHWQLRLVCDCWTGQWDRLRRDLGALNEEDYQRFVETALRCRLADPLALLAPGRSAWFLDVVLPRSAAPQEDLVDLAKALVAAGEPALLSRLEPYLAGCPAGDLRALEKIARHPEAPESFRNAVTAAVQALPSGGIKTLARRLFGRPQ